MFIEFGMTASVQAETKLDRWYQIGYDYSQMQRNDDAFEWMMRAADGGHSGAQNNIGLSYLHGLGVKQDEKQAFEWFEKSAKQGLPYAQSELAMLHYEGKGTEKDIQLAQNWWLTAAKQQDEYAQYNLASLMLEKDDIKSAYYWFNLATKNNHPDAKTALDLLNEKYVE
ncbi:tetratricopeptide repeat protein [Candidatus Thioglobus sp.]